VNPFAKLNKEIQFNLGPIPIMAEIANEGKT